MRSTFPYAQDRGHVLHYGSYIWQSVSNDYVYVPGGGYNSTADGLYGDLPDVRVEMRIDSGAQDVWYRRTFHTPAGTLNDVIQFARPDVGSGDGPNPHRVEPLVKESRDLEALAYLYPMPRRDLIEDIPLVLDDIGDRAVLAAVDCTHAGSWGMEVLGPEQMLIASVTDVELLQGVCRMANDAHLRNLRAMLEQGIEVVYDSWFQCGPSVGWSPQTYETIFLPLVREAVQLTHEFDAIYIYQDDGKQTDIIPFLVEADVDVIAGLQPPEIGDVVLSEVKRLYGDKVALMGGLDPCYTFDQGTPEGVRQAVRQAIHDGGAGGGYVVATGEAVSPATPAECLRAAVQAVKDFGVYGR